MQGFLKKKNSKMNLNIDPTLKGVPTRGVHIRVSQKIQKSEFWNVTYPSGFHRLDEPPEKISAL